MRLWIGTSGYSYREWTGAFYPEGLPAREMLRHYAGRLSAVEINNTFYRLPTVEMLEGWAEQVPADFRFVLKASRRITHFKRLRDAADETSYLLRTAAVLGERLGAVLFQLPPDFKKDLSRLEEFLEQLPRTRAAFEFRHPSWFDEDVEAALRAGGFALCGADRVERPLESPFNTAEWGYLRLRRPYTDEDLAAWAQKVTAQPWEEAFVFFKHEQEAQSPLWAARFRELTSAGRS
jgi:uncharacterized protein YecE (DUF72 family)